MFRRGLPLKPLIILQTQGSSIAFRTINATRGVLAILQIQGSNISTVKLLENKAIAASFPEAAGALLQLDCERAGRVSLVHLGGCKIKTQSCASRFP